MTDAAGSTSGSTITTATGVTNTGTQSNRNNNRDNRQRHNNRNSGSTQGGTTQTTGNARNTGRHFKGDTEGMNGHVFQCFEERSDPVQFTKTMEALHAYSKRDLKTTDLSSLFGTTPKTPVIAKPSPIDAKADELEQLILKEEVKAYVNSNKTLKRDMAALHSVAWGQCSEALKAKIKSITDFQTKHDAYDCVWLLSKIASVMQKFEEKRHMETSMVIVLTSLMSCRQGADQKVSDYIDKIRSLAETIEHHGGKLGDLYPKTGVTTADSRDRFLASLCMQNADRARFGTLLANLANQFLLGHDEYPSDLTEAQGLLTNYQIPVNAIRRVPGVATPPNNNRPTTEGNTFAQAAPGTIIVPDSRGRTFSDVRCFHCQSLGHYAGDCPTTTQTTNTQTHITTTNGATDGTTLLQHAFVLAQHKHKIDPNWILLDSQSTISVFNNPKMLTNIRDSGRTLRAITNGGHQDSTKVGDFPNLGEVWFNPLSIANILSLADVSQVCRVTMDSDTAHAINVHRKDGTVMIFSRHPSGLYVFNSNVTSPDVTAYTLVNTVATQKKLFTPRQVQAADAARDLYRMLGRPSEQTFQHILRNNLLHNCPVTPTDASRALTIYGKDVPYLKGTTTKTVAAPHIPAYEAVPLPPPVLQHHLNVTLCADFFYVQRIPFFHTISRNIGYRTATLVPDRHHDTILLSLQPVLQTYSTRGFTVTNLHGDHEFECVRADLPSLHLDVVPADSHVGEVERSIRTIKERLRSCVHGLPFTRLPKLFIQHLVIHALQCLNQFPWPNGISSTMSPASLVTGVPPPDYTKLKLEFGSYVQTFEDNTPTNTPKARSLGAIALTPTGNATGDYYFLSLATGACISRHQWTLLPITDQAISRVEALAKQEGQPLIQDRGLVVEWRPDYLVDDDEYDRDYAPPDTPLADVLNPHDYDPLDPGELQDLLDDHDDAVLYALPPPLGVAPGADQHHQDPDPDDVHETNANDNDNNDDDDDNNDNDNDDDDDDDAPAAHEPDVVALFEEGAGMETAVAPMEEGAPAETPAIRNRYDLRERHPRADRLRDAMDSPHDRQSYHAPVQLLHQGLDAQCNYIFGWVMTQMTAKAGLKKHGVFAETALLKEFTQQKDLDVWEVLDPLKLTFDEKMGALRALNLLKEKRNGDLKGRTVADGSKQKGMYPKSKTASPTVNIAALMLTILIDAYERRDVATADVAGAYLKATMPDRVIIKFVGESVDILLKMEPLYERFVTIEKGVKVLYARLKKALYGCVQSALLWYNLFHDTLKQMGFIVNPYDPCVANCMIDGSQCTIAWYVDDTKISHVNPNVVTRIIDTLEGHFGKMTVTRGREHVFLGMNIVYTDEHTAKITMKQYLQEALEESNMDIKYEAATPARKNLFDVDQTATNLTKAEAEIFHSVTAKLLYVAIRARMDILLPVGFLGTRVSKSTTEDWAKLKRLLEYIKGTINEEYTLGADSLTTMRSWVDASFAVHPDMKSHTGGLMSYGLGGFACKSTKQKTTMRSSTHAEMVGVSDYLPTTIWVTNFMREQGYPPLENFLEQDNESAIKLEVNGRTSAGAKSRHLDIRYFWIKENLENMGINVRHCRTLKMLADFLTKPQQGTLFRVMRDVLLGKLPVTALDQLLASPSLLSVEERVGNMRQIGRNTDDENDNKENIEEETDGFILVKRKKKHTSRYVEKHALTTRKKNESKDKIVSWSLP
jgi:hypothetical protein